MFNGLKFCPPKHLMLQVKINTACKVNNRDVPMLQALQEAEDKRKRNVLTRMQTRKTGDFLYINSQLSTITISLDTMGD